MMETLKESKVELINFIRDVKDFPKAGIVFKDLTPVFKNPLTLNMMTDLMHEKYKTLNITKVACIESRGFLLGGALANKLCAGLVPIRKPGKLPWQTYSEKYMLEYGYDEIQVHTDAFSNNDIVLLHDDLLATGGTMQAAINLVKKFNVQKMYVSFICELEFLMGRKKLDKDIDCFTLIKL